MRNVDIRERLHQPPVFLKLKRAGMKWFGRGKRMEGERQVKKVMSTEMEGRRRVRRPRTIWIDVFQRHLQNSGPTLEQAA